MAEEKNPYPPGSARAKLWDRQQADKKKAEDTPPPPPPPPEEEGFLDRFRNRDKKIDEEVEEAQTRRRRNQSTDSRNA